MKELSTRSKNNKWVYLGKYFFILGIPFFNISFNTSVKYEFLEIFNIEWLEINKIQKRLSVETGESGLYHS